ncbi:MAG: class I SAM-dependent methyltransferase [Planctomycetota bacterium]
MADGIDASHDLNGSVNVDCAVTSEFMAIPFFDSRGLLDWNSGVPSYHGLEVIRHEIELGGHQVFIHGLNDAADLLDREEFERRFLEDDVAPYGMELWPAATMLARALISGEPGNDRTLLELGCGLGLVAIAASFAGWRVTATDNEPAALDFAQLNSTFNRAPLEKISHLDWQDPPRDITYDLVVGADLTYEIKAQRPLLSCISNLLSQAGRALICDPNRGIADRFPELAVESGFSVRIIESEAQNRDGERVKGRLFELTRGI